jgi:hypothetical protein
LTLRFIHLFTDPISLQSFSFLSLYNNAALDYKTTVSDKLGKLSKETAVVYFNILSQHTSRRTEENYEEPIKDTCFYGEDIITGHRNILSFLKHMLSNLQKMFTVHSWSCHISEYCTYRFLNVKDVFVWWIKNAWPSLCRYHSPLAFTCPTGTEAQFSWHLDTDHMSVVLITGGRGSTVGALNRKH